MSIQFLGHSNLFTLLAAGFPQRVNLYLTLLLGVLLLQLSLAFLRIDLNTSFWWILDSVWLAAFLILDFNFFSPSDPLLGSRIQMGLLVCGWCIHLLGIILYTAWTYLHQLLPRARSRATLWILMLIFTIPANIVYFTAGSTLAGILQGLGTAIAIYAVLLQIYPNLQHDPRRTLQEFSRGISTTPNLDLLATLSVGLINEAMEIQHGFLFQVNAEVGDGSQAIYRLHGARGMGEDKPAPVVLPADSSLAAYILRVKAPFLRSDFEERSGKVSPQAKEWAWLSSLLAEAFVPVFTKEDWIGLLVLGPKVAGASYTPEDLDLLSLIGAQIAVAMQNTRLVESLTRLNNDFRRAYSSLERVNQELARLDRAKSDFISISSHELRTPLSVIRGYTEILKDEQAIRENPHDRKMVNGIHAGILRLDEIVDSMLDMASIDTRSLELNREPVSINMLVRLIVEGLRKPLEERKLSLTIEESVREISPIEGDSDALRKVFVHLITNAIKFTPDGGCITLSARELPSDANTLKQLISFRDRQLPDLPAGGVEVIITDTGVGIAQEFQDLIFTKFYQTGKLQLHSTGKTKFKGGGQGLGLAIAKGIIEAHGGMIWVESLGHDEEKYPGSQFHVVLPIKHI